MKSPEEFETQIDKAIEEVTAKGFRLRRGTYGNESGGCALTAGCVSDLKIHIRESNQVKLWAVAQVGLVAAENFENGFDKFDMTSSHENAFYQAGQRLGQKWKPSWAGGVVYDPEGAFFK